MTVINTNSAALLARAYGQKANQQMLKPMERLSSGLRINSASDDAAGLAVGSKNNKDSPAERRVGSGFGDDRAETPPGPGQGC